jgi:hypothetical protein
MDFNLCPYKNIFGKPNSGVHQYRIMDIAIVDLLGTILVAFGISKYFNLDFKIILFILLLWGIILHELFCVKTTLSKIIFF